MNLKNLRNRLLASMLLGVLVYAGLIAYGDFRKVGESFSDFRWELMPLILLVTCGNYALRFVKWEYYLRQIGVEGLRKWDSFLIYFSGLGMTVTPGKVGEWLKSYLLREVHGTPVTRSAPILLAERLTDSLALLVIAGLGVIFYGHEWWPVVAFIGVVSAVAIAVSRHRPTSLALIAFAGRMPVVRRLAPHFESFYESTYVLMNPAGILLMTALSVSSWFFEVLAFHLTLVGLGVDSSWETLFKAAFILPIATLAAAIAFTPGGLGVAEAGITALTKNLFEDISSSAATLATIVIRIATLWFGVAVGLITFAILMRKLSREGKGLETGEEPPIATIAPAQEG
ncbi:MAG TPA: lysylphosphatidylglycerol synthase transmembrane domain-containing protein [Dehalococcoidia bacterium]|nr:lysylphosphatidylglycerol synthase transmembrane domain-containing protein [Dehalococcoidia bacterium]